MRPQTTTTRVLQIGMLILLGVSFAQVIWWTLDQAFYSSGLRSRLVAHWEYDRRAADRLLARGSTAEIVEHIFPHLEVRGDSATIRAESLQELDSERYHRLRRYGWEGTFFMVVLAVAMTIVIRAIREEARLRKRQQNFLSTVSHEFKSPLASLQLSAETMAMRELEPERRNVLVQRMLVDVSRMERMSSKILNTSRLEQSKVELHMETLSLASAVSGALSTIEDRARESDVEISTDVPDSLLIFGDLMSTRTVVQNLIENAVQATAQTDGGRVTIQAHRGEGQVTLEVSDTGIGFRPVEAKRLFQKFYRSGDELRRTSAGTGLGLFIVKRLMHHQRGSVKADSEGLGKGAVFTVIWPAAKERSS